MRLMLSALAAAGLALCAAPISAAEQGVIFEVDGETVIGTLSIPNGQPAPIILLFHGFGGSRHELAVAGTDEGVFSRTARLLADEGFASLRIDFRGSGESDGEFYDTTFERQIADGLAAIDFITADPRVDGERLGVIGWSQGGLVASAVAARSNELDAVALWAAVASPKETYPAVLGAENVAAGLTTGDIPLEITMPWGAVFALRQPFFEGVENFDPLAEIAAYEGPLFVAQGTLDTTVLPASADALLAAHPGEEESWIEEMDHVFNVFTNAETLDAMVAATTAFLDKHMQ